MHRISVPPDMYTCYSPVIVLTFLGLIVIAAVIDGNWLGALFALGMVIFYLLGYWVFIFDLCDAVDDRGDYLVFHRSNRVQFSFGKHKVIKQLEERVRQARESRSASTQNAGGELISGCHHDA